MTRQLKVMTACLLIAAMSMACTMKQALIGLGIGVAAAAVIGAVVYTNGDLEGKSDKELMTVHQAAQDTAKRRGYAVTSSKVDGDTGVVEATIPQSGDEKEKALKIKLKKLDDGETHISIRVGLVGDEDISKEIMDGISKELEKAKDVKPSK